MQEMSQQRKEEIKSADDESKRKGSVLNKWNRAMGSASATATAEELRAKIATTT